MKGWMYAVTLFTLLGAVALASPPVAHADPYLVRGTFIDPGVLEPPDLVVKSAESAVFPSLATLSQWVDDGKIVGGVLGGARAGVFIVDAASNHEAEGHDEGRVARSIRGRGRFPDRERLAAPGPPLRRPGEQRRSPDLERSHGKS